MKKRLLPTGLIRSHVATPLALLLAFACAVGPVTTSAAQDDSCPGFDCPDGSELIKFEWDDNNAHDCGGFVVETSDGYLMDGSSKACFLPDDDGIISSDQYEGFNLPVVIVSVVLDEDNEIKGATYASSAGLAESAFAWYKSGELCAEIIGNEFGGSISATTQAISYIAICYRPTPPCPYPTFTEEIISTQAPGQVKLTVSDANGIVGVDFVDEFGDPYLINFTVTSDDLVSTDGIHWAPSGTPPTTAELLLTQTDVTDGFAAYYAKVSNGCGNITHIDPAISFETVPSSFKLEGNYPNPFNPTTSIRFSLAEPTAVSVTVYDVTGREVKNLVLNQEYGVGVHSVNWDGTDVRGRGVVSGVYLYRVDAGRHSANGKMVMLK